MYPSRYLIHSAKNSYIFAYKVRKRGNLLTLSRRPTFAFSTAFCRDTFRCFASEIFDEGKLHQAKVKPTSALTALSIQ